MNKSAYIIDIFVRGFFVFIVCYLLTRMMLVSLVISGVINLIYETTIGKKNWTKFRQQPKKPKRKLSDVLKGLWVKCFSRDKTKGFVWAGIIILFMSLFVPLNIYYQSFACLVFILAAVSRFATPAKSVIIQCESNQNQTTGQTDSQPIEKI